MKFVRNHALALLLLGTSFFAGSVGLVGAHALKIRTMRDVGFPIAAEVKPLLQRKAMLTEQAEIAALQASARGSSYREIYDLYVLPEKVDAARMLTTLETLLTHLQEQGIVKTIDMIHTGPANDAFAEFVLKVTVADGTSQKFFDLFDISGVLTVNDAFTESERATLIALTERENPAVIAAVEQFLGGDLLQYAKVPQLAESQLFKAVGTDRFETDVRALIDGSRLRAFAQTALILDDGNLHIGQAGASLWPLPLCTITEVHWEHMSDGERLTLTVRAHGKAGATLP